MKKLALGTVLLAFVISMPGLACAKAAVASTHTPGSEGTIHIALTDLTHESLDPILVGNAAKMYLCLMYDWLIGSDDDGSYNPDKSVAYKWEGSSDHMSWTFWIRRGIKFHNGDELTPEDVKFSLERNMSDLGVSSYHAQLKRFIKNIKVVPPDQVVIQCKVPVPFFPYWLSNLAPTEGIVMPKKYIEEKGNEYFRNHPIGSGPYRFAEQALGSYMKFEAMQTAHWWAGIPKYKHVFIDLVPESGVRKARLKTGEADIIVAKLEDVPELKTLGFKVITKPGLGAGIIFTQMWNPENPLSKLKVRKAISLAINKEEILQYIFKGLGRVSGLWPCVKGSIGWVDTPPYPYDPDEARRLLAEAGYPDGFVLDVYAFKHKTLQEGPLMMEVAAGYINKIGIKTNVLKTEYVGFRTKTAGDTLDNPASIAHMTSGPRTNYIGYYNWLFRSDSTFHCLKDPKMDAIIDTAQKAATIEDHIRDASKIYRKVYDEYLICPLVEVGTIFGVNNRIKEWNFPSLSDYDIGLVDLTTQR